MLWALYNVLAASGVFFTLLGLLVAVLVFIKPMRFPADTSNRIAHLRLVWFALTRPERFTELEPWLKVDELDLVKGMHDFRKERESK